MGYLLAEAYFQQSSTGSLAPIAFATDSDRQIIIPANTYISNLSFKTDVNQTVNIGTTPGGNDLLDSFDVGPTQGPVQDLILNKTFVEDTAFYFTGLFYSTAIKIYTR